MQVSEEEGAVPSSQAKLDELFLHWLSLPDTQQYVLTLLNNAKRGQPLVNVTIGDKSPGEDKTSPKNRASVASPPPRSPTGRSPKLSPEDNKTGTAMVTEGVGVWPSGSGGAGALQPVPPVRESGADYARASHQTEDVTMTDKPQHPPAARRSTATIPRFFTPGGVTDAVVAGAQTELEEIGRIFSAHAEGLSRETLMPFTTKVCGYPSFFNQSLFNKMTEGSDDKTVSKGQCQAWWTAQVKQKSPEERLFNLLRNGSARFVSREDWREHLSVLLDTHPGLDFLKGTPEFQDRYLECVVERIYYVNNRAENYKMTLSEIQRSNLCSVLKLVDEEPDINKVMDYFSYEHFYVLYCKFWELDTDHDFLLDRDDVVKLSNYALTYRIVDRVFAGACRPITSQVPERLGYSDFIWLLLSEEDKHSETAIRYWFRGIDLDNDGYITPHEMEFFYKEQLHRMDCLAQEVVQFEDILCQMTDMVKPAKEGYITMMDLRKCKQAGVFFNVLFNLTKFIQYDQKDPGQIFNERATPELTDWDRYAKVEYARLAQEEDQGDGADDGEWEMEAGGVQ
mmetsp:Transcript_40582/g.95310  ORF Transcript_40582/g.95310 Transcript_40582/m.95310 type:complete len:566 (+) Transcript_40582:161-1858(+)